MGLAAAREIAPIGVMASHKGKQPAPKQSAPKPRFVHHRRVPVGAAPGTLVPDEKASPTSLRLIRIFDDRIEEIADADLGEVAKAREAGRIWLDVTGLADLALIAEIGRLFSLNPLAVEDIANPSQRPKVDIYDEHPLIIVHMFDGVSVSSKEQVALVFTDRHVLTFQERPGDCLDPVRKRLSLTGGRIRARGAAYLAYAILDTILDAYFPMLERIGEELEELEDRITANPQRRDVARLHEIKRGLLVVKRALWPSREMLSTMAREELGIVPRDVEPFLRDTYDHAIQLIEVVETYRELAAGLLDLYLTSVSTRMNEVVKVLTIVSTIFIPLTFLAGIWGMNFDPDSSPWNMPETVAYFGYPAALGVMLAVALGLVAFFRWKKWL
jgi:magnesium transporter